MPATKASFYVPYLFPYTKIHVLHSLSVVETGNTHLKFVGYLIKIYD